MNNTPPTTLPHSALNSHIGADANLGLLLLANGYDYFNFPGLIDAYLDKEEDAVYLHVLHTGELQKETRNDLVKSEVVTSSGIADSKFHANPDYKKHFIELIEARPAHIKPSLVDRMNDMLKEMKKRTPNEVKKEAEDQLAKAAKEAFKENQIINPEKATKISTSKVIPLSGERKMNTEIPGELPESATEALKEHLRSENKIIIKPK